MNYSSKLITYHKVQKQIENVKGNSQQMIYADPPIPLDDTSTEFYAKDNTVIANILDAGYYDLAIKAEHNYLKYFWKRSLQILSSGGYLIIKSQNITRDGVTYNNSDFFIEKAIQIGFKFIRKIQINKGQHIIIFQKFQSENIPTAFTEEIEEWNKNTWKLQQDIDFTIIYRLVNLLTNYSDNILHIFQRYSEFFKAITIAGRNSLHCGSNKLPDEELQEQSKTIIDQRITNHLKYLDTAVDDHAFVSQIYGFKVKTQSETTLWLPIISQEERKKNSLKISYK